LLVTSTGQRWGTAGLAFPNDSYTTYASLGLQKLPVPISLVCAVSSKDLTGNLGSIDDRQVNLSIPTVASLLAGQVTCWDDTQIQVVNSQLSLPHQRVSVVVRSDTSNLNEAVTRVLSDTILWWSEASGYLERAAGITTGSAFLAYFRVSIHDATRQKIHDSGGDRLDKFVIPEWLAMLLY